MSRRLTQAEGWYLIARARGIHLAPDYLRAAEMLDGDRLCTGPGHDDEVVRRRTELVVDLHPDKDPA